MTLGLDGLAVAAHHVLSEVRLARILLVAVRILAGERDAGGVHVVSLGVHVQRAARREFGAAIFIKHI